MSPASPNNRDDLILQRLEQLHTELQGMRDGLRDDLRDYELKALHDKDIENLKQRDDDQEQHLQRLEDRVLSQSQRWFINISALIGACGGLLGILHMLHLL